MQFYQFSLENPTGFYGAMFDEVDEGTAFYKVLTWFWLARNWRILAYAKKLRETETS